jgi:hypothetical protein
MAYVLKQEYVFLYLSMGIGGPVSTNSYLELGLQPNDS